MSLCRATSCSVEPGRLTLGGWTAALSVPVTVQRCHALEAESTGGSCVSSVPRCPFACASFDLGGSRDLILLDVV